MDIRMLGPLEASAGGTPLPLGGGKPRALLVMLALQAGSPVSKDRLIYGLWGEQPPATASKMVQIFVSQLRKALGAGGEADRILTRGGGYELRIDPDDVDARRFERLLAAEAPREALALWRGVPLEELAGEPFAAAEMRRLEELRLSALELAIEQDLAAGRHREVVAELEMLVGQEPLRERLHAQRMLALYRSGRQSEALDAFRGAREVLVEQVGLEPGPELRRLNDAILQQDPELDPPAAAAPAPREQPVTATSERRVVSVMCARVANAAALAEERDPEALHGLLARFSDACGAAVERHGGTLERRGAEAVIGIFGLDAVHEDDALRALRAALELREAVAQWDCVHVGVGVDCGPVFVGAGERGERFASGQAVSNAERLQEAAQAGSILLSEGIHRLVEPSLVAEPVGDDLRTWELASLRPEQRAALSATPFVGRDREVEALSSAFAEACDEPGCRFMTFVGPAGIGKSRLARELIGAVEADATVVVGRCLSYGVGITYGPIAEIARQLGGPGQAAALLEPGQPEEIFLGFRRLLEDSARERPLVVVMEDVHWAEPTLLDLLEYVAAFSRELPILFVCLARPELLEARPAWAAPQDGRSVQVLEALTREDAQQLVEALGANGQAAQIVDTAEGNPLFLEQLVADRAEHGDAALPPTIHALLAARIDQLDPAERAVLLRASVEGRSFHAGALRELLDAEQRGSMEQQLVALVRKQLIRVDRPELAGEDAFRFTHALVREAAYEGLSKQLRAELHERLGRYLDGRPEVPEEIVGYHLEQAHRHGTELGTPDRGLADEAATRLESAARGALARGDSRAGAGLLERAVALLGAGDPARSALMPRLGAALFEAGRLADSDEVLAEAIDQAVAGGDEHMEAQARVERQFVQLEADSAGTIADAHRVADAALGQLARHHDERGQSRALSLRASIAWLDGQVARADEAWEQAAEHARRAGDERELFEILGWRASAGVIGPTPVPEAIERCLEIRDQVAGSPLAVALTLHPLAALNAMTGDFDQARRLVCEGNDVLGELGRMESAVSHHEALVELLAGQPQVAEARLRDGYEELTRMGGDGALLATTAAMLAQAIYAQDRFDEAGELCDLSARTAPPEDLVTQVIWRGVQAKILARAERHEEAERLAREGVALVERTDLLNHHGDALLELAAVLRLGGREPEAEAAVRAGRELHERKGNLVATSHPLEVR
jgi:DNA-binding SARP family transcriptional activator/tetratricopeptide (TPR) repeat protein